MPGLQQLIVAMEGVPAFVLGRRMDVLAWNRLAVREHWARRDVKDKNFGTKVLHPSSGR